jgi:hypothetical protein
MVVRTSSGSPTIIDAFGRLAAVVLAIAVSLGGLAAKADEAASARAYRPVASASRIQDKNFYLLTLLETLPRVRAAIAADRDLTAEAQRRRVAVAAARAACKGDPDCLVKAYLWSDEATAQAGRALVARLTAAGLMDEVVRRHMRPSGRFARYATMPDDALVAQAWTDAAAGMNHILRVWGLGEAPLYPLIDSRSYPPGDKMWKDAVDDQVDVTLETSGADDLFFSLPLRAALDMLDMNDRDEPARLEPLSAGENARAMAFARTIDWGRWRYPAMLIPGRSPTLKDNPLSPEAKMKLRLAARRYAQGLAPLIIVSGGYVSPSQTRFAEALEMKRALMSVYRIPERAILVDPYARHTTTNLRNAARLLIEAGAPLERPILVTTTDYQSRYIEAPPFRDRCLRELGYPCFSDLKRVSMFDTTLRLPLVSLHRDARDPLDP